MDGQLTRPLVKAKGDNMAAISGIDQRGRAYRLSITPVTPALDGPRDAYDICFESGYGEFFSARGDVHGWQLGHYHFDRIAELFRNAERVLDLNEYDLYPLMPSLYEGLEWFHVILLPSRSKKSPDGLTVMLFVSDFAQEGPETQDLYDHRFVHFRFNTVVAIAQKFGNDLIRELNEARRLRIALGIATDDDVDHGEQN